MSADIACIGVAKKLFQVDGLEKDENHLKKVEQGVPFNEHLSINLNK